MRFLKHIYIDTNWGRISVEFDEDYIVHACSLSGELMYDSKLGQWPDLTTKFKRYLAGEDVDFNEKIYLNDLPEFTREVYIYLQNNCKWGQTMTYGGIAKAVGNPKAARAVGQVMNKNRVPIFVPWHRVLSKRGLGGFASGLEVKKTLLKLEEIEKHID